MKNVKLLHISWIIFLFASFDIYKLFLFPFVEMLALQIYSYSYSQEQLQLAEHCLALYLSTKQNAELLKCGLKNARNWVK